jgi:hypothetical protein
MLIRYNIFLYSIQMRKLYFHLWLFKLLIYDVILLTQVNSKAVYRYKIYLILKIDILIDIYSILLT